MDIFQVIILAIVQGFTEFLPISSSAHLVLIPYLVGWQDQGLAFDVTVHLGSLVAVCYYLRKVLIDLSLGGFYSLKGKPTEHSSLAWMVVLSTLPAVLFGLLLNDLIELHLRSILVIAMTTILFGILLAYADRKNGKLNMNFIDWKIAIFIGMMQVLALIPGTSRSGITITAALLIGLTHKSAATYSFILSVPLILAASLFKIIQWFKEDILVDWFAFIIGFILSAIFAWLSIHFLLKLVEKIRFLPFVIYRILLGFVLLMVIL